ncbi:hypothetical protein CK203_049451 [Vitis vinifera]|uniref:Retrotransposon gag domain-containing protein n=1 Tax=Vitis vinifera TaxID=29760 RepID=A0A438HAX7_VITVI|nr:hypothetical protein CK203_049451 [Vitis vinifera]
MARTFKKRVKPRPLHIGDLVLRVIRGLIRDPRGKFRPSWSGPYFIRELTPEGAAWLMDLDGNRFSKPTKYRSAKEIHISPLVIMYEPLESDSRYCNLCMPYWIRDQEGRLVRIENPQDTELDICVNIMDPPPEDQNSQQGQGGLILCLSYQISMEWRVNPYAHIKEFEEVCNTFREGGASIDLMRLKLFPFTLKDKAKIWLNSLRPRSIRNWVDLQAEYMEAINACPHHGFDTWLLVSYFYDGMSSSMKQILETMCGGDFMSKNPEEAMDFLSYVAEVSRGWDEPNSREKGKFPSQQTQNPKAGMYMLNEDMDMKAKVATIARRLEELELKKMHEVQAISETQAHGMPCTICQSCDHVVDECPTMPAMREMLGDSSKLREVKAVITLRSGKEVDQPLPKVRQDEELMSKRPLIKESNNQEEQSGKKSASKSSIEEEPRIVIKEDMMKKHMPPHFPQALHGEKEIKNSSEILEVLRQVKVNIPLLDMIKQVPTYAKFLKDLCTVKRGLQVTKNAFLTEQVSVIIQSKSPVKYKDLGCPTISVNIGGTHVEKALLDLGASVNLLPYSVYKQLGLGGLKPTSMTLSLADRSVKIPRGVIEDVLVQVDKFYYPVDFVVLDTDFTIKEENYVPIILGRPFLATFNAIINCRNGVMQITFGNMTLELNIFHLCKRHLHPEEEEGFEEVCLINTLVEEHCDKNLEESLNESLEVLEDGFPEPSDVLAIMSPWRRRERDLTTVQPGRLIRSCCGGPSKAYFKATSCGFEVCILGG